MDTSLADRITLTIAGLGLATAAIMFLIAGPAAALGALIGGVVAVANWLAIRWIGLRIVRGSARQRGLYSVLLALKMAALAAICWGLIARWGVDPLGFVVGLGAFVGGILLGTARSTDGPADAEDLPAEDGATPSSEKG